MICLLFVVPLVHLLVHKNKPFFPLGTIKIVDFALSPICNTCEKFEKQGIGLA